MLPDLCEALCTELEFSQISQLLVIFSWSDTPCVEHFIAANMNKMDKNTVYLRAEVILDDTTTMNSAISTAIHNKSRYSKTCVKRPLKNRQNKDLNDKC